MRIIVAVEPSVIASRCGAYRSLFDRRSGLLARYLDEATVPGPELLEVNLVGPDGELFELSALRRLLEQAPLCRQVLLTGAAQSHPALSTVLRTIRDHGVVPTVVCSALPSGEALDSLVRFAGLVALDCGFNNPQLSLARSLRDVGLRVALHLPVADASLEWLATAFSRSGAERVAYSATLTGRTTSGPAGQVTGLRDAVTLDALVAEVSRPHPIRLSADARIAPFLASGDIGHACMIPRCEAARTGLFVGHDLRVTPCSLLPEEELGSLESESLGSLWSGRPVASFRRRHSGPHPPCAKTSTSERPTTPPSAEQSTLDLRFGLASSSLCDRALIPLSRSQLLHIVTAVKDWRALRFFADRNEALTTQIAASWSSLEYFLSLPPMWGQDLARLHEQLVAGTFEGQESSCAERPSGW